MDLLEYDEVGNIALGRVMFPAGDTPIRVQERTTVTVTLFKGLRDQVDVDLVHRDDTLA
jgi:hypothetical protein